MVAVIGDVHGCFYTLTNLIEEVETEFPQAEIYLVGDLIDRGRHSCEVMDFIAERKIKFTAGNHDYMFYHYFRYPHSTLAEAWFSNGAEFTLKSYENRFERINEHIEVIKKAPLFFNLEDCFISHAGISIFYRNLINDLVLNDESVLNEILQEDIETDFGILWNRGPLLNIGKLQVVGHTRMSEPRYLKETNALYVDTAAISGNKLTAAIIEENRIEKFISVKTQSSDIY
ncbi:Diadenosine tetraphosphatase-like protein [Ignavibacterium album JCM 16511]|uniref:Diadenosine tetraphosphatase-like protein n=1 Tax=Ignavibacterium album (strain DSM 19864 / JCM 16511 / NBRC 101810 / Mat9-16) TaxID=945713 RepID=I0ALM9_IGNAJ|nr:metallophosphoesterase [Ignavibacterium album]AFH49886.1 Diadenosine tetraphosphatase-like protein [Ignavibacterium album JCM 16511]